MLFRGEQEDPSASELFLFLTKSRLPSHSGLREDCG